MEFFTSRFTRRHSIIAASIFVFGVVIVFAGIWSHVPPKHVAASGYSYYRTITVTSTASIASGTLTNFPMLVSSTLTSFEPAANGGQIQNLVTAPNGGQEPADLVFATSSANCGVANLNFETESYVSSTGALVDWVNVPTMQTGTVIYACYGNAAVTTDQSHPSSTWNSNYQAVYHLASNSSTLESTANKYNLSNNNSPIASTGKIDGSVNFTGTQYLSQTSAGTIVNPSSVNFTLETWINPASFAQGGGLSPRAIMQNINGSNIFMFMLDGGTGWTGSSTFSMDVFKSGTEFPFQTKTEYTTSSWYHVVAEWNLGSNSVSFYVNGVSVPATAMGTGFGTGTANNELFIGARSGGTAPALANIDEVRLSNTLLASQWVLTEYNNQASPSTFYAVGSETPLGGGGTATSTWVATSSNSWSVPTNWSPTGVPGNGAFVLFSGSSTLASTIDTTTAVQAFTITSAYTSTITQSSNYSLTIASSGFSQASGTFTGGTGNITVNGPFSLAGGTFNSTNGKLYLYGATTTFSGGTFNNNSGTVVFGPLLGNALSTVSGSATFYDLWLGDGTGSGNIMIPSGTTFTVLASTTFAPFKNQIYLSGSGQISAQGDILLSGTETTFTTSTFNLTLNGSGNQTINDEGNSSSASPFYLPSLTINKPSGIALVAGNYLIVQSTTVSAGEFRIASNTTSQVFVATSTFVVNSGAFVSDYAGASSTVMFGSTVVNNGTIFFDGSGLSCVSPSPNYISINSTASGVQRIWSGNGNFIMRYVTVADQGGSVSISDLNGTSTGGDVSGSWTFPIGAGPELVQSSTAAGGSGTSVLALPAFGFKSRAGDLILVSVSARNQTITAPTDNASNTYVLVASSTFSSSPSYALSLYYAKNITPSSSLIVTVNGGGGSSQFLSGSAFEYTGMDPSSTFDTYSSNPTPSASTALTSLTATGHSVNELYFGAMTFSASTTASVGSGWAAQSGVINNSTNQALYVETIATSSPISTAATWTAATSTLYTADLAIFRPPQAAPYPISGTLDSATFDTGVTGGAQLNSFIWQGTTPSNSSVQFQFAVSNSSGGPWNFEGPDGTSATYFSGTYGTPINLVGISNNNYTIFNGYRYFRYRATLRADSSLSYTPTVNQVTVNWSP